MTRPAVTPPGSYRRRLGYDTPEKELRATLRPLPAEHMTARPADPWLNKAGVEGPECLGPAARPDRRSDAPGRQPAPVTNASGGRSGRPPKTGAGRTAR